MLAGKGILIIGGGTGLGKALARHFVAHGAAVHICGRREAVLQAAVTELQAAAQHGGAAEYHLCDVREAEQIEAMVERIWQGDPLFCSLACGRRWIAQGLPGSVVGTFAALGQLTPADWAEAKAVVRARAEQEKAQRSTG